jgi:hypothetical protein
MDSTIPLIGTNRFAAAVYENMALDVKEILNQTEVLVTPGLGAWRPFASDGDDLYGLEA